MNAIAIQDTFAEYRAVPRLNSSHLYKMEKSPLEFKANPDLKPSRSLELGRLNHLCTLEHDLFLETAVVWKGGLTRPKSGEPKFTMNKNSLDFRLFKEAAELVGQVVVDQADIDLCETIRTAVLSHPTARAFLTDTVNEQSIYWTHKSGLKCKSRIDALGDAVVDLKFLHDITPKAVGRSVINYHYDSQAAFYSDAVSALTGDRLPYYIIAAEKVAPFDVVVYEVDEEVLGLGRSKYERWILRYQECMEANYWPGISDVPIKVEIPQWHYDDELTAAISMEGMEIESE